MRLPEGANLGERLLSHIVANPVGREIFGEAKIIENDVHAFSALPYDSEKVSGDGWAVVGDAAGFIDPLYSPGLDFCSYTSYYVSDLVARNLAGEDVSDKVAYYNTQFPITYRLWFETLYKDKYYYMGDAELMSAALLLDVGTYFLGLVIPVYKNPEREFAHLPFEGKAGQLFASMMKFYNRRLVSLARRRLATGYYGRRNAGWRELYDGFVPDIRLRKLIQKGLLRWWKCELVNLGLMVRARRAEGAGHQSQAMQKSRAVILREVKDLAKSRPMLNCEVLRLRTRNDNKAWMRRFAVRGVFWRQYLDWALFNVPFYFLPVLIWFWTLFFFFFAAPARRAVLSNLEVILPGSNRLMNYLRVWRTLYNFAWTITEGSHYKQNKSHFVYEIDGADALEQLAAAKSAIVLTAHMGNYDLGRCSFRGEISPRTSDGARARTRPANCASS